MTHAAEAAAPAVPEQSSGKGANDENFPVGSFLVRPELRPDIAAYYAFARATDDIADDSTLIPEDKVARLQGFERALLGDESLGEGYAKAYRLRERLLARNIPLERGADLLSAFKQDAVKRRYETFAELEDYCARSANPVGRFLVDLHGESPALYPASDALCTALQVLNHLQDCQKDLRELDRVYIPLDWLKLHASRVEDIALPALNTPLRSVINRMLDRCEAWVAAAQPLARGMADARFAMEAHTIVSLAARLCALLRSGDPLATRVKLSKLDFAAAGVSGLWLAAFGRKPISAAALAEAA